MGRKKKAEEWKGTEYFLLHEAEIRRAVKDERREISFLRASGNSGGSRGTKRADRTGALAVRRAERIRAIVLDDGRTVREPEAWLAVFDAVRRRAAELARPEDIFDAWAARYSNGGGRFVGEIITGKLDRGLAPDKFILWIIENTEAEAAALGLLEGKDFLLYRKGLRFLETVKPGRLS